MDALLKECFDEADEGKYLLEQSLRSSGFSSDAHLALLIFPADEKELLEATIKHLNEFMLTFHYDAAVLVASFALNKERIEKFVDAPLHFVHVTEAEMQKVVRFAAFAARDLRHVKIISLDLHYLANARKLIGFKGITFETLAYHSILGLLGRKTNVGGQNDV
jgi:hypothetical protein